jgi:hypothetical protein
VVMSAKHCLWCSFDATDIVAAIGLIVLRYLCVIQFNVYVICKLRGCILPNGYDPM